MTNVDKEQQKGHGAFKFIVSLSLHTQTCRVVTVTSEVKGEQFQQTGPERPALEA